MDAPGSGQSRLVPARRAFHASDEGPPSGAGAGGLGAGGLDAGDLGAGGLDAGETGRPAAAGVGPAGPPMTASGLVRRRPKSQSPFPDLDGPPPGPQPGSGFGEDAEDSRPMYSWNPSDTTEAFPAVPPPGDSHPG